MFCIDQVMSYEWKNHRYKQILMDIKEIMETEEIIECYSRGRMYDSLLKNSPARPRCL